MLDYEDVAATLPGANDWQKRALGDIKYIVIHHSGAPRDSSPQEIADYHVNARNEQGELIWGWPGIGYTFVVSQTGIIYRTGGLAEVRYNVASRNCECVGVCLPGDWTAEAPPPLQLQAAARVIAFLKTRLAWAEVKGHREVALPQHATSCPGDTWEQWRRMVNGSHIVPEVS